MTSPSNTEDVGTLIARLREATGAECIPWDKGGDLTIRGRLWVNDKIKLAHRALWEAVKGPIPKGKILCHDCDNRGCINLSHIYVGTHADNMRDMKERKRFFAAREPERVREIGRKLGLSNTWARGESNPKAKLSSSQAATIRRSKTATRLLAAKFGVDRTTIQRIRKGSQWT